MDAMTMSHALQPSAYTWTFSTFFIKIFYPTLHTFSQYTTFSKALTLLQPALVWLGMVKARTLELFQIFFKACRTTHLAFIYIL